MTVDLVLVRHGITDWNVQRRMIGWTDVELNEEGLRQARDVARALRLLPVRAVLASPQRRAQQTAEPIAQAHGTAIETVQDIAEVWAGRWTGQRYADLRKEPELWRYVEDPTYRGGDLESAADVQNRVVRAANTILERGEAGSFVVVSHGDPLRLLIAHFLSMPLAAFRQIEISNGSVSIIRLVSGRPRRQQVLLLNWRPGDSIPPAAPPLA